MEFRIQYKLNNSRGRGEQFFIVAGIAVLIIFILCILPIDDNTDDNTLEENNVPESNINDNTSSVGYNLPIIQGCSDNTEEGSCSINKPYYCLSGNLIKAPEICGCAYDFVYVSNNCVLMSDTNSKEIDLNYTLRGKKGDINYIVYEGLNDYLAGIDRTISYSSDEVRPTNEYIFVKRVTEEPQLKYISPLVDKIKQKTDNSDDQARIAINMVQTIPYDREAAKNLLLTGRYPYEVLYDQTGVCGEKSKLLALILKELGYGVVLFSFDIERHEAVGIKCPMEYSYINSGYCFIESTNPTIITDADGNYTGVGKLVSVPAIYMVSDGKSFDSVIEEVNDYNRLQELYAKLDTFGSGKTLSRSKYREWKKYYDEWLALTKKYGFIFDD